MSLIINSAVVFALLTAAPVRLDSIPTPFLVDNNVIPKIVCGGLMGTGSFVGHGLVITARHVINDSVACTVNGQAADIILPRSSLDYAFLKIKDESEPRELIDCSGFHEGQELLATGYALDLDRTVTQRVVASEAVSETEGFKGLTFLRGSVTQGMSGGPINDLTTGAQVGIINANMELGLTVVLGLPLSATPLCKGRA